MHASVGVTENCLGPLPSQAQDACGWPAGNAHVAKSNLKCLSHWARGGHDFLIHRAGVCCGIFCPSGPLCLRSKAGVKTRASRIAVLCLVRSSLCLGIFCLSLVLLGLQLQPASVERVERWTSHRVVVVLPLRSAFRSLPS